MSGPQRLVLAINLPGIQAEEALREKAGELTPEGIRALTLAATGSKEQADDAFAHAWDRKMRAEAEAKARTSG